MEGQISNLDRKIGSFRKTYVDWAMQPMPELSIANPTDCEGLIDEAFTKSNRFPVRVIHERRHQAIGRKSGHPVRPRAKRAIGKEEFHRSARFPTWVLQQVSPRNRKRMRMELKNHLISSSGNTISWATKKRLFRHKATPGQHRSSTRHLQFVSILVFRNG